jgi:cytochrome P450
MPTYPPGPPSRLLVGNLPEFAADLPGFLQRCTREYGDVVGMRLGTRRAYLLNHPDHLEYVFVKQHRNFIKHTWFWRHVPAIFGNGLLTSEGDFWLRQRRLAQPAFHRDRIAAYGEVMVAYTERMLDTWREGEIRNVHEDMMGLTLRIAAKALFDADVEADVAEVGAAFDAATKEIAVRFRRPFRIPDAVPIPGNVRYRRAVRRVDALVYRIIRERRNRTLEGNDLLSLLMLARDEDGRGMSEKQLRDESVTLLLAGHETTALALSWTFYLLSRHPAVEEKLVEEIDRVIGSGTPTVQHQEALPYTEAIIQEALRLFPPAYVIGREAVRDCVIGGYDVPAGTTLFMSPWVLHRDPRYFEHPEEFDPVRWLNGLEQRLPKYVYHPFGGGPRLCIGKGFAMMESVLLLATIARRFRLTWQQSHPVTPFPTITLRPQGGVWVRLSRR